MKIVVYSDVHGNKYALEELKNTTDYKTADKKIFLGDMVSFGAYPNECIESIKNSGDDVLIGNHDVYCAYGISNEEKGRFNKGFLDHLNYVYNCVTTENREYLKSLNYELELFENKKKFNFSHYLWKNKEMIAENPDGKSKSTELTAKQFDLKIDADYIFYGHNHTPSIVDFNDKKFVCVGSLGVRSPGNYLVLNIENNSVEIEHKKIEYNSKKLFNEMLELDYPGVKQIINFFGE